MPSFPFAARMAAAACLVLTAAPALAQSGFYRATFADPVAREQFVAKDLLWSCAGESCSAGKSNSRAAIVCAALAKEAGPLAAFSAGGTPLDEKQLAECNARAS